MIKHGEPKHDGRLNILVVEDEALVAMLVEDMVTAIGHRVIGPVGRQADAIEIIRRDESVDCAIIDLNLDGAKAFAVADALSERRIPFILATGYGGEQIGERFGAAPILHKPFMLGDLRRAIDGLFERAVAA